MTLHDKLDLLEQNGYEVLRSESGWRWVFVDGSSSAPIYWQTRDMLADFLVKKLNLNTDAAERPDNKA